MNFIDLYVDTFRGLTDASTKVLEKAAIFCLSSLIGRHFSLLSASSGRIFKKDLPDIESEETACEGKYLNFWCMVIGKSRISRKTTVISHTLDILESCLGRDKIIPCDFTPQGLVTVLSSQYDKDANETRAVWMDDEIGGFFDLLNKQNFMSSTDTLLSKLYDGQSYRKTTLARKEEVIINPYLTIFASSTPYIAKFIDETNIVQGFLNRFAFVIDLEPRELTGFRESLTPEQRERCVQLKRWALELSCVKANQISIILDNNCAKIFDSFCDDIEKSLFSNDFGILESYWGNLPEMALKLACLHRIGEESTLKNLAEIERLSFLGLEKEDVLWGIAQSKDIWENFQKFVSMVKMASSSKRVQTNEFELERLFRIIQNMELKGIEPTRARVLRESGLTRDKFEELINTLIRSDRISAFPEDPETEQYRGGRKKIVYKVVKGEGK